MALRRAIFRDEGVMGGIVCIEYAYTMHKYAHCGKFVNPSP
jgi:hypothetical protein